MKVCLVLVASVVLFSSCSRPTTLSGEVFVVTAGAGSYKFGDVGIQVIKKADFEKRMRDRSDGVNESLAPYLEAKEQCDERFAKACYQVMQNTDVGELVRFLDSESAVARATTNADGKYTLTIKEPGDYIIVASASRKVPRAIDDEISPEFERYSWVVPAKVTGEAKELMLTDANAYSIQKLQSDLASFQKS